MGSAIAFFLKQRAPDLKVTVLERDWNVRGKPKMDFWDCIFIIQYTTSSTVLSAGGLRQQFALVISNFLLNKL